MRFVETALHGVWIVEMVPVEDTRGHFARSWCSRDFASRGLSVDLSQCSISRTRKKGTIRGMHYQRPPKEEAKLVRCTRGAVFDVAIDLRPHSPTFMHWEGRELTAEGWRMLYIPEGCAHGLQALQDDSEVSYMISAEFAPETAAGVRWDDPLFAVRWPLQVSSLSEKDRSYPDYVPPLG